MKNLQIQNCAAPPQVLSAASTFRLRCARGLSHPTIATHDYVSSPEYEHTLVYWARFPSHIARNFASGNGRPEVIWLMSLTESGGDRGTASKAR